MVAIKKDDDVSFMFNVNNMNNMNKIGCILLLVHLYIKFYLFSNKMGIKTNDYRKEVKALLKKKN
jgi:hypothetical protein